MHFPVAEVEIFPLIPVAAAFGIASLTSMGGVSGAFLLMPFQVSLLGFSSPAVTPTNHLYNVIGIPSGIYRYVKELCEAGAGILLISSDLPEILHLTNRTYVLYRGEMRAELEGEAISQDAVLSHFFEREAA